MTQEYKKQFIEFALARNVLKFGEFTLKSGRTSPYFFNAGLFNSGASMNQLCGFFADSIIDSKHSFDVLFGPAYKGITLACGTSMALAEKTGEECPYAYNRKEQKDHGEGGNLVGSSLVGRVAIIDDVITAGTAIRESFDIIEDAKAKPAVVFLALDRQEKGQDGDRILDYSAIEQVKKEFKIPVVAIATMQDLISYLEGKPELSQHLEPMRSYRERYGV